jgi:uracil-DNA glycosylase
VKGSTGVAEAGSAEEFAALIISLRRHLQRRQRAGIRILPRSSPPETKQAPLREVNLSGGTGDDLFNADEAVFKAKNLQQLRDAIGDCRRCKLCAGRTNLVFGVGNPDAELMFVGEGPGRDEDLQGEPFVGRAGQLLTDIITKGIGLKRGDVYIANVVKCRPPENRNPEPDEVAACEPFLKKQIELVRPRVIVALGKFAVQTLLQSKVPITKLRGKWHSYHGIKLMPTFHPAYLLRNPADKKLVWEDIKKVINELRGENT